LPFKCQEKPGKFCYAQKTSLVTSVINEKFLYLEVLEPRKRWYWTWPNSW